VLFLQVRALCSESSNAPDEMRGHKYATSAFSEREEVLSD